MTSPAAILPLLFAMIVLLTCHGRGNCLNESNTEKVSPLAKAG